MDCLVGKPMSTIEVPFTYTVQGMSHTYYMSHVSEIIRGPHARILISMGGPVAWLGYKWGGMELVAQMSTCTGEMR
jgi:hypothetical protein